MVRVWVTAQNNRVCFLFMLNNRVIGADAVVPTLLTRFLGNQKGDFNFCQRQWPNDSDIRAIETCSPQRESQVEVKLLTTTEVNNLCTMTKGPRWKVVNLNYANYAREATCSVLNRQLKCVVTENLILVVGLLLSILNILQWRVKN